MFLFLVENIVVGDVSMTPLLGSSFNIFLIPKYASLENSRLLNSITLINKTDAKVTYGKMQLFQTL